MKARTETNSTAIFNNNSYSNFTPGSTVLKSAINGDSGKIHENEINRHFGKRNHIIPPRKISPSRYKYKIIPEEIPIKKDLKPLDFHTNELLEETPQIFKSLTQSGNGGSNTFIYLEDPCQTFVIPPDNDEIINRKNTLNQMKAANGSTIPVNDGEDGDGGCEFLSYVIEKNHSDPKMNNEEESARQKENVISEPETKMEPVTNFKVNEIAKPYEISANNSDVNTNCCKKHSLEYNDVCDTNVQCNGEKPAGDAPVLSFDRRKEQTFAKLQDELQKAHQELKLKDEEVSRLTRIREDVEKELEDLTASLFQEAHKMVREANEKQAAAEKAVTESQMKVEVLTAEVAALKTLVLTSTPSRPNPHLHPQLGKDEAAGGGVNLFNRKHRRSPSHFNLKYGRENSPPESPVRDQQNPVQDSLSVDVREPMEVDPLVHKEFLNWKQTAKLDKTLDPTKMKAVFLIFLVCLSVALSAQVRQRLYPEHPVFAGKRRTPKIVGGQEAPAHSIPFQVALFLGGSFCGGSLISQRWVLTAAHCGELTNRPQVVLGAHRVQESESSQVVLVGSRVIVHSGWDSNSLRNDIALIQLPQNAPLNQYIGTVSLAGSGDFTGRAAQASGWGLAYDGAQSISPVLRYVVSTILSNSQCQSEFGGGIPIYDTLICLDGSQGKSTCSGDSGGPLVDVQSGLQIGLTSFGVSIGCEKGYPAAFTRISSYASWIQQNTK